MLSSIVAKQNRLLAALPQEAQTRLLPHMECVRLRAGQLLYEAAQPRRHVYFPTDAIVSLLNVSANGASSEVAMIGNEGVVGTAAFMGGICSPWRASVQRAGGACRILGTHVKDEFDRHGAALQLLLRYSQARSAQMAQTAACNRYHSIEQQLCRWMLLSLDRQSDTDLSLTHESIANRLGVRREGVTDSAGKLQKLGAISCHRGRIAVLDRRRLEHLSCECYAAVHRETERLLPRQPHYEPAPRARWNVLAELATA